MTRLLQVDLGPECAAAGIRAAFTTVAAGNLALDVNDDPGLVATRRDRLTAWADSPVRFAHHVHGTRVLDPSDLTSADPDGDAWVSDTPGAVAVHAADCLPVVFADPVARVIGAAHAGRVGLLAGVLERTVERMGVLGAGQVRAVIGPAICGACYDVAADMAASATDFGLAPARTRAGAAALDLPAIATAQLTNLGVEVRDTRWCTLEDPRFFSHRGTATGRPAGRHAGIITLPPTQVTRGKNVRNQ